MSTALLVLGVAAHLLGVRELREAITLITRRKNTIIREVS